METDRIRMESDSDNTFYHITEYEYKRDVSNSETNSDIYSIWKTTFTDFLYSKFTITKSCKD
jgi:hypothetical protein